MSNCAYLVSFWHPLVRPGPVRLLLLSPSSSLFVNTKPGCQFVQKKKRKARKEEIPQDSRARKTKKKKGKKLKNYFQDKKEAKERLVVFVAQTERHSSPNLFLSFWKLFLSPAVERKESAEYQ